jgi:hypothetical protein
VTQIVEPSIHAKPEKAAMVKDIAEIVAKIALLNNDNGQPVEQRRAAAIQIAPLYQRKNQLERVLAAQIKGLVVATGRKTFGDRYQLILDREAIGLILDKPLGVELVDVSMDLQNALLAQPAK